MKKYWVLGVVTLALMFGVLLLPEMISGMMSEVRVTSMVTACYAETVYASGTVEEKEAHAVKAELPVVLKRYTVSEGDVVGAGETIAEVDVEGTQEMLLELASGALDETGAGSFVVALLQALQKYEGDDLTAWIPSAITAPVSGTVSRLGASAGELILPGEKIVTLSEEDGLVAVLSVSESDVEQIAVGQEVELTGTSSGKSLTASVSSIAGSAHKQLSGTSFETVVDVTVELEDGQTFLRPGYSVNAEIKTEPLRQINLLPYEAVGQDDTGEYVYLYDRAASATVRKTVVSGVETEDGVEIVSGIYPSDLVVYDVTTVPKNGGTVRVQGRVG